MEPPSERSRKRTVAAGLRRLQQKPGWNPAAGSDRPDAATQLRDLGDATRRERTYDGAADCADCGKERAATGDETALCEAHLADAMGLG